MSKVQDFKIYANTDIYCYNPKYIKEYLNIYIRHIFGYSAHKINYSCDLQKEISDFQSIQSQVQIQREVTIKDLYNKLGIEIIHIGRAKHIKTILILALVEI